MIHCHRHHSYNRSTPLPVYTGGAGIIVKDKISGKVLLGKRTDHQGWANSGGKRNRGETAKECAIRELHEEFGIKADPNKVFYCGKIFARAKIHGKELMIISEIFKYEVEDSSKIKVIPQQKEISETGWFSFKNLVFIDKIYEPSLAALNKFGNFDELKAPLEYCVLIENNGQIELLYKSVTVQIEYKAGKMEGIIHNSNHTRTSFTAETLNDLIKRFKEYVNEYIEQSKSIKVMYDKDN